MSAIYEIDPEADTLVIVRPLAEFAAWPDRAAAASTASPSKTADVRIKASAKHLSLASPRFRDLLAQASIATATAPKALSGLGITYGSPQPQQLANGLASPPATPNKSLLWHKEAPTSPTLSVASTVSTANTAVAATRVVDASDTTDGRVHIAIDGVDADAVKTVLNIVHGRAGPDRVPRTVTLDALARIAVVVDRFKLHDAVGIYADHWVDALYRHGIPTTAAPAARRDLVLWIYIAYVFQRASIFKEATQIAATQLTSPLPVAALANLPLRTRIVQDIEAQRQAVVGQSLALLAAAVDKLVAQEDEEDAPLLGSLIRTLHKNKLYWPQPAAPYAGVSVAAISRAAHDVQTQAWRAAVGSGRSNNRLLFTPQLDSLRASVAGLELKGQLGYRLY